MTKKDILQIAVKIFGLYFLAQAVLSFPRFITSIWMSCSLYEPSGTNNGGSITHQLFKAAIGEIPGHCVSVIGFTLLAIYLLRGAPHLMRFMQLDAEK